MPLTARKSFYYRRSWPDREWKTINQRVPIAWINCCFGGQRPGAEVRRNRALNCWPWVRSLARGYDPFAGENGSSMTHDRHDVTMSANPRAQDAETILGIVVGYALDQSSQHFPGR